MRCALLVCALAKAKVAVDDVAGIGLDTPDPASVRGVFSSYGSTNLGHPQWAGFDIRGELETKLGKPMAPALHGNKPAFACARLLV